MVERFLENDAPLLELPYMRWSREEGRREGRKEVVYVTRRQDILTALTLRFGAHEPANRQVAEALERIRDATLLETLLAAAIQCVDIDDFQTVLDHSIPNE